VNDIDVILSNNESRHRHAMSVLLDNRFQLSKCSITRKQLFLFNRECSRLCYFIYCPEERENDFSRKR
jgi:hypothetical protein